MVDGTFSVKCKCYDPDYIDDYVIQIRYSESCDRYMEQYKYISFSSDTDVTHHCPIRQIDENSCGYVVCYYIKIFKSYNPFR